MGAYSTLLNDILLVTKKAYVATQDTLANRAVNDHELKKEAKNNKTLPHTIKPKFFDVFSDQLYKQYLINQDNPGSLEHEVYEILTPYFTKKYPFYNKRGNRGQ